MATWKKLLTEVDYGVLTSLIATAQATADAGQNAGQVSSAITAALADYSTTVSIASTYATISALNAALTDISDLQTDYTTLSGTVSSNTTAIGTNTTNIANNATAISDNVTAIATNTGNITTNANAIQAINTSLGDYAELAGAIFTGAVTVSNNLTVTGTLDVQTINYASTTQTEILIEDFTITVGSGAVGAADTLNGAGLKVNASGLTGVTSDYGLFYQNSGTYSKFELGAEDSGDYVGIVRKYTTAPTAGDAVVGKFAVNATTGDMYIAVP
jgi:cytoskeletal protein CcmA (bactofilin family)